MKITLPISKGDTVTDTTDFRDALPVNYVSVMRPVLGAAGYLASHPGLSLFATGMGLDRGGYYNERQGIHFRVSGNSLINVEADGSVADLGAISGSERASMAHSFLSQSIVADGKWWLYDGTLTQITDPDLGSPIDHTWIDNYYFFTDGEYLFHTDITNERSIDPLKFATSEFSPDPTLAVDRTSDNQVVAFNRYTTEYFENVATDNFAFRRIVSKTLKCGVVGTHAETELEGTFYVLGGGREESVSIHAISSGTYQSIASREVDQIIETYTDDALSNSVLETRVDNGQSYILVRLPNHTFLFNMTVAKAAGFEAAWTIVKSSITGDGPWRGVNGVKTPSGWIYGDNLSTNIGSLNHSIATQYGNQVESIFYTPMVQFETMSVDELEMTIIPGFQVNTDNVTTFLSITYDGISYGNEWTVLYGERYKYGSRFIARTLGYIGHYAGFKCRTVSAERLAFSKCEVTYS